MFGICPVCESSTVKTVNDTNRLTHINCVDCEYEFIITFPIPIKELEKQWDTAEEWNKIKAIV